MRVCIVCFALSWALSGPVQGQTLEKGFEALHIGDYFKAKASFEQNRKKGPALTNLVADFGLCSLFATRELNRFYNPDSALPVLVRMHRDFAERKTTDAKGLEKIEKEYGITAAKLLPLRDTVLLRGFEETQRRNSLQGWERYIKQYGELAALSSERLILIDSALGIVYVKAFAAAKQADTPESYQQFVTSYSAAPQHGQALALYELRRFQALTRAGTPAAYLAYMQQYPKGKHYKDAEDSLYVVSTRTGGAAALVKFARTYPKHPLTRRAWQEAYKLGTNPADPQSYILFLSRYRDYPWPDSARHDYRTVGATLYPIRVEEKYGFIDTTGLLIIACSHDWADDFVGGLALIEKNGKQGFLNKKGEVQIPCTYDEAERFTSGVAIVRQDKRYGLIDTRGRDVLQPEYDNIGTFTEGIATIRRADSVGFINTTGRIVIPMQYKDAGSFSEGLAWVRAMNDSVGFVSKSGRVAVLPSYSWAEDCTEGMMRVRRGELYGVIDSANKVILPIEYTYIGKPAEGMMLVARDKKFGYADRTGKLIVPLVYDYGETLAALPGFSGGTARIQVMQRPLGMLQGLVDKTGKVVIQPRYERISYLRNNLAAFEARKKWGFINKLERTVVPPKYELVHDYAHGLARVMLDGKWGYVDTTGNEAIPPQYDAAENFTGLGAAAVARVKLNGKTGMITRRNEPVIRLDLDELEVLPGSGVLRMRKNGKMAYYHQARQVYIWREAYYGLSPAESK